MGCLDGLFGGDTKEEKAANVVGKAGAVAGVPGAPTETIIEILKADKDGFNAATNVLNDVARTIEKGGTPDASKIKEAGEAVDKLHKVFTDPKPAAKGTAWDALVEFLKKLFD